MSNVLSAAVLIGGNVNKSTNISSCQTKWDEEERKGQNR